MMKSCMRSNQEMPMTKKSRFAEAPEIHIVAKFAYGDLRGDIRKSNDPSCEDPDYFTIAQTRMKRLAKVNPWNLEDWSLAGLFTRWCDFVSRKNDEDGEDDEDDEDSEDSEDSEDGEDDEDSEDGEDDEDDEDSEDDEDNAASAAETAENSNEDDSCEDDADDDTESWADDSDLMKC